MDYSNSIERAWKPLQHIYLLFVVLIGWVFFRANDFESAIEFLSRMFFINNDTTDEASVYPEHLPLIPNKRQRFKSIFTKRLKYSYNINAIDLGEYIYPKKR